MLVGRSATITHKVRALANQKLPSCIYFARFDMPETSVVSIIAIGIRFETLRWRSG